MSVESPGKLLTGSCGIFLSFVCWIVQKHRRFSDSRFLFVRNHPARSLTEHFKKTFPACWIILKYSTSPRAKHCPVVLLTGRLDAFNCCTFRVLSCESKSIMLHVYVRRSPSPVRVMSSSSSTSNIRTSQNVQAIPSSYSASNLAVGGSASRGEPLGEPRHQYRPQRPTFLNVPDNTYCLSCLPSGLSFSAAMAAKQLPAPSREEVRHSPYVIARITRLYR